MKTNKIITIVLVVVAFGAGFGVNYFLNSIPDVYKEKYGLVQYFKDTLFPQPAGDILEVIPEEFGSEDKIPVIELPANFEEKNRLFEETIKRLSSPLNNPIRAYKSKTFPLIFIYSQFDPIFGDLIDEPIEKGNKITINDHTISIYKKDSNLAMDQVIKSKVVGFDPKKCTIHSKISEYNQTGMTVYIDTEYIDVDKDPYNNPDWSDVFTQNCGALSAKVFWYVDNREELKDFYFEYPRGYQEPTGTILTSDGAKVMWHETVSLLK